MTQLIYFRIRHDEAAVVARLREIAAALGYLDQRGGGSIAEMLAAIAGGELVVMDVNP